MIDVSDVSEYIGWALLHGRAPKFVHDKMIREFQQSGLKHLEGLLVVVCQYLRLGKYYLLPDPKQRGKSRRLPLMDVMPMLANTDLATMYRKLVPDKEKWIGGFQLEKFVDRLTSLLMSQTGR